MQLLKIIEKHQAKLQHHIDYKLDNAKEIVTLDDQEEACQSEINAYFFAKLNIPGTDIKKCQEAACKDPEYAYYFAHSIHGANIKYCQEYACKDPEYAYMFGKHIPDADIEYCRKAAQNKKP